MNRWEIEKKIAIRALKDPAFKKKLLSHPKEALREFFERSGDLDKLHIKLYEEKKNEWIISIPYIDPEYEKLSDKELEKLFAAGYGHGCHPAWCSGVSQVG